MATNTTTMLLGALPEPFATDVGGTNYKLADSFQDYYGEWDDAIAAVGVARFNETAVGAALDGKMALYGYSAGGLSTPDGQKRIKLGQKIAKLWGAPTYDEMLALVATLTGMTGTDITVRENVEPYPSTTREPAAIEFLVTSGALIAAGIPPASISAVLSSLADDLTHAAPAGVRVYVTLVSGATYDSSVYDDPASLYAS